MPIDKQIKSFFDGMEKNSNRKSFKGTFALLRELIDPLFICGNIKELQLSEALYQELLNYCNQYSDITFSHIAHWCTIPIVVNDSFEDERIELHYKDRIVMKILTNYKD